jgi:soluble lytic murein transglycosylase-like protein
MRIPEAPHPHALRILPAIILAFACALPLAAEEGGAFGLSASRLAGILAGGDAAPILALDEAALADAGDFGPLAYYSLARWIASRWPAAAAGASAPGAAAQIPPEEAARARLLYRLAFDRGQGLVKKSAGLELIASLSAGCLWDELLAFSSEYGQKLGPEWKSERPRLDALDAKAQGKEASALAARLAAAYPKEAAKDAEALAYFSAAADFRLGGSGRGAWKKAFRRIILEGAWSDWASRSYALALAEKALASAFSESELRAAAMREAVWRREYGRACAEALAAPNATMSPQASRSMLADAGKAFLYSGNSKEGEKRFAALASWTALFYRARFARSLEAWGEAAALFSKAAAIAPGKADAESAAWYAMDSAYSGALASAASEASPIAKAKAEAQARANLLSALVEASKSWKGPEAFADLAEALIRDSVKARDWKLLQLAAASLPLGPSRDARLRYIAARALELGLGGQEESGADPELRSAKAAELFASIVADKDAPLYYRLLAAWRAGVDPSFFPAPGAPPSDEALALGEPGEEASLVGGMARFGLGELALAELRLRKGRLSDSELREIAGLFAALGRPDCGLRTILELGYRAPDSLGRADYELLYPRPYLEDFGRIADKEGLSQELALGLVRSESVFRVDVVSRAGAVGLSQLMPATAAERAAAIGLKGYDLKDPKDNLAIGLSHFGSLLYKTGNRPLRAMMAYNAGWGRLRTWATESGDLPDDLMVEALGIEETRQYCRNILEATAVYGELYYGKGFNETLGYLVEGK